MTPPTAPPIVALVRPEFTDGPDDDDGEFNGLEIDSVTPPDDEVSVLGRVVASGVGI